MKKIIIALLGVMLLANVGFAETTTPSITASILTPVRAVSMGDVAFGLFLSGSESKSAADTDLAFSSNYTYQLSFWGDNAGLLHIGGTRVIPLYYAWSGTEIPLPAAEKIGLSMDSPWILVPLEAEPMILSGSSCDYDAGNSTFALGLHISTTVPEGDYATVLHFDIVMP